MKKIISIILTALIVISCISAVSINAAEQSTKITLNGKTYTYSKNTYVTYTCKLTTSSYVVDGQYELSYPENLIIIENDTDIEFPVVGDSACYNYKENVKDIMKFNFTKITFNEQDAYNFTKNSTNNILLKIKFKVVGNGSGKIELHSEILTDYHENSLIESSVYTETLTKSNYATPKISDKSKTIYVKKSFNLKVTGGTNSKINWISSDKKIATVSSTGKVIGKKAGKATITATKDGVKMTCKITIKNPVVKAKKTSVKTKKSTTITVKNAVGTNKFKSLTPKIAKVNSKGKVTGLKKGTAKILVTASGVKFTIKIKVK